MIVQEDFLNKLKDFGLNSYESKLWVALLSRGVSTAGELSDISNVPRSRAYDVLESLEKKGFVIVKVGKPIKYLAVSPGEVVERVKKKVLEDAEIKNKILSELKNSNILEELNTLHTEGIKLVDPTDKSGSFRGRDKVHEHLLTMVKKAQKNVTLAVTKEGAERKQDLLINTFKKLKKNGVEIKVSVPVGTDKNVMKDFSNVADVQETKMNHNSRFCIVDNQEILLFLTDDQKVHQGYDSAVWIEAPLFVNYLNSLFENDWNN
tara:strand:+ start:145 stop:933 length:789 start_codon:yes stop_codon:yes gene_type:complete